MKEFPVAVLIIFIRLSWSSQYPFRRKYSTLISAILNAVWPRWKISCNANNAVDTLPKLISNMIVTQQIMLCDRKYLHIELIGLRVRSPAEAVVNAAFWNRVEIAIRRRQIIRDLTVTEVWARLHGKVLRECFKCKRNYEKLHAEGSDGRVKRERGGLSQWTAVSSSTRKEHSVRNGLYLRKVK